MAPIDTSSDPYQEIPPGALTIILANSNRDNAAGWVNVALAVLAMIFAFFREEIRKTVLRFPQPRTL